MYLGGCMYKLYLRNRKNLSSNVQDFFKGGKDSKIIYASDILFTFPEDENEIYSIFAVQTFNAFF